MTTVFKTVVYFKKQNKRNNKKRKETLELRPDAERQTQLDPLETEDILMFYDGIEHLMNTLKKQTKRFKATLKSEDFLSALKKLQ